MFFSEDVAPNERFKKKKKNRLIEIPIQKTEKSSTIYKIDSINAIPDKSVYRERMSFNKLNLLNRRFGQHILHTYTPGRLVEVNVAATP